MIKAHRSDAPMLKRLVLVEELEISGTDSLGSAHSRRHSGENVERRIMSMDERVYITQSEWRTNGRFVIMDLSDIEAEENMVKTFTQIPF